MFRVISLTSTKCTNQISHNVRKETSDMCVQRKLKSVWSRIGLYGMLAILTCQKKNG